MRICLINPPQIIPVEVGKPSVFQPLGLAYIAAILEKKYEVKLIDANAEGWKNLQKKDSFYYSGLPFKILEEKIRKFNPDVVGITIPFAINEFAALKVVSIVRKINRDIKILIGGPHPSSYSEEILKKSEADFVIVGEGEETTLELLNEFKKKKQNFENIFGIVYKQDGKIIKNPRRPLIKNLDSLPFPARHLLPMKAYFDSAKSDRKSRDIYTVNPRWATVVTSRGCPYGCVFCSINNTMGREFRKRSPENVVAEIEELTQKYGVKHINFEDDNLTFDKKRFIEICNLIINKKINITWSAPNGVRADTLNEEVVKKMKESGCKRVFVAPESGVQKVITNIIGKNMKLEDIENAIRLLRKYNITVDASFVIGLIGETKEEIHQTINYALKLKKMGVSEAGIHIATPYRGTRLYDQAKEKGYIPSEIDNRLFTTGTPIIETPDFNKEEIKKIREDALMLLNPNFKKRTLSLLKNPIKILKAPSFIFNYIKVKFRN